MWWFFVDGLDTSRDVLIWAKRYSTQSAPLVTILDGSRFVHKKIKIIENYMVRKSFIRSEGSHYVAPDGSGETQHSGYLPSS
jgi:hypothetical protein